MRGKANRRSSRNAAVSIMRPSQFVTGAVQREALHRGYCMPSYSLTPMIFASRSGSSRSTAEAPS